MSEQYIYGGTVDQLATGSTSTMAASGNRIAAASWYDSLLPAAGTAGKLRMKIDTPPGAGKKWEFNFLLNGGTELTVEIADTATTGYSATTVAGAAFDVLRIEAVPTGTPAACHASWCWTWEPTTDDQTILCGCVDSVQLNAPVRYVPFWGVGSEPQAFAINSRLWFPIPVTLSHLHIELEVAPGVGNRPRHFQFRDNGVVQTLGVTIEDADTTGSDTSNSFHVPVGHYVDLRARANLPFGDPLPPDSYYSASCVVTPDTSGYFLVPSMSTDVLITGSATEYRQICTGGDNAAWNATVIPRRVPSHRAELVAMAVHLSANPESGTWTFSTLPLNGPSLAFSSGSELTQVAHAPVLLDDGDYLAARCTASSVGGLSSARAAMCLAMRAVRAEGAPFLV